MFYRARPDWELPASAVTPEAVFLSRRQALVGLGAVAGAAFLPTHGRAADEVIKTADLYPAKLNEAFKLDRPITPEKTNLTYNNFYEFSLDKRLNADALRIRPWTVTIGGMVEKEKAWDIDDLVRTLGVEERLYRHRCVEAWGMAIPWSGFPLRKLVEMAKPTSSAKYVRFESFLDKKHAPGQRSFMPWPYVEGLTMAEATNDLAFVATGAYGKPISKNQGAPIRLALPWKYGFKSAKSIVKITFTDKQPETFWAAQGPGEYGFWANVNPEVPHPRWSQASETDLTTGNRRPTLLFNGYGEQVAALYKGLEKEPLYM